MPRCRGGARRGGRGERPGARRAPRPRRARRARPVRRPVPADRLAATIWADDLPATWQSALRGVVRGLRYGAPRRRRRPAPDRHHAVRLPARRTRHRGRRPRGPRTCAGQPRCWRTAGQAAADLAEPVARQRAINCCRARTAPGSRRTGRAVEATACRGPLVAQARTGLGEHHRAVESARRAVTRHPLDERTHRSLIRRLDRAGRPGRRRPGVRAVPVRARRAAGHRPQRGDRRRLPRSAARPAVRRTRAGPGAVDLVRRTGGGRPRWPQPRRRPAWSPSPGRRRRQIAAGRPRGGTARRFRRRAAVGVARGGRRTRSSRPPSPWRSASRRHRRRRRWRWPNISRRWDGPLLVLDGCEPVVDGVASLARRCSPSCPQLTVVVTSRVPLALEGERVVTVEPLRCPTQATRRSLLASAPVRLLLDRVREGGGELRVDDDGSPRSSLQLCGGAAACRSRSSWSRRS